MQCTLETQATALAHADVLDLYAAKAPLGRAAGRAKLAKPRSVEFIFYPSATFE
jgi:hypothetical protein